MSVGISTWNTTWNEIHHFLVCYTRLSMYLGRADLEGNFEFLQELNVLPFQGRGKGVVPKEMRHFNYTCK